MRTALSTLLLLAGLTSCSVLGSLGGGSNPELVVASYNIRHGRGMDNRVALERTAAVLRTLDADIIGLQEVDSMVNRSNRTDEAAILGGVLGMQHRFAAFMDYDGGRYGMAILSRHPIVSSRAIALPEGEEPRVALAVVIEPPEGERITAINIHFDWVENDGARVRQARALAAVLDTLTGPWLLMGDFNDGPSSRTLRTFEDLVQPLTKPADSSYTFPSTTPTKEIDHIFVSRSAGWRLRGTRVVEDSVASDHRPVVAWRRGW